MFYGNLLRLWSDSETGCTVSPCPHIAWHCRKQTQVSRFSKPESVKEKKIILTDFTNQSIGTHRGKFVEEASESAKNFP